MATQPNIYQQSAANFLNGAASGTDLRNGVLSYRAGTSEWDKIESSFGVAKSVKAFVDIVKEIPLLRNLTIVGDMVFAANKISTDMQTLGYISPATHASLVSTFGGFMAVAGGLLLPVAPPLGLAVLALGTAVGVAMGIHATTLGLQDKQREGDMIGTAAAALEALGKFDTFKWTAADQQSVDTIRNEQPILYPVVEMLHYLSPSITVKEALSIIDGSFNGPTLQEVTAVVNAVRSLITQQSEVTVATPADLLGALQDTFTSMTDNNLLSNYTIKPWSASNAQSLFELAKTSASVRASLVVGAPFYIDGLVNLPVSQDAVSLFDDVTQQGTLTDEWLRDRIGYLSYLAQARENEAALNVNGAYTVIRRDRDPYTLQYFDISTDTMVDALANGGPGSSGLPTRRVIFGNSEAEVLQGGGENDRIYGGSGDDTLKGGAGDDHIEGQLGADHLTGEAGDDWLYGGAGSDNYYFEGAYGQDVIVDSDRQGVIYIDGQAVGYAKASGRDRWTAKLENGQLLHLKVEDDARSMLTGKRLLITRVGETSASVSIENFSLESAFGAGDMGITLQGGPILALFEGAPDAFFDDYDADVGTLAGRSSTVSEGTGRTFTVYLNRAFEAGTRLVLSIPGLVGKGIKAILGDSVVDADGAVIELAAGQTQVSFALTQEGELDADTLGALKVTLQADGESHESNSWGVDLRDAGAAQSTLNGDFNALTVVHTGSNIVRYDENGVAYAVVLTNQDKFVIDGQGNLVAGGGPMVTDNTLYGSAGNDVINGLTGNDLLSGGGGNDQIDGGIGDDMIGGGDGDDKILGGDGNDFISSSADVQSGRQQLGPSDRWVVWGKPLGAEVLASGTMWGVYPEMGGGDEPTQIWHGIAGTRTNAQSDTIEAGAGNDRVMASWGHDRVDGGDGDDVLEGLAGDDVIEGGEGKDYLGGDGIVKEGYLNTVEAARHGSDFLDGGTGDDELHGGGAADRLFGGDGADLIFGDNGAASTSEHFIEPTYHGDDYIDGENGDDDAEGNGGDDVLYGGSGKDRLWGDQSASRLQGAAASDPAAWGRDYLDGEDDDDQLVGGGSDDKLFGGTGNDVMFGDDDESLSGDLHGNDYLDGEEGDDQLVGGGGYDRLFGGEGNDALRGDDSEEKLAAQYHAADYLDGEDGNDFLIGGGGDDTLLGGAGDDHLDGGTGADYMEGGEGNDTYIVDDWGDVVVETGGAVAARSAMAAPAYDNVDVRIDGYTLGANLENMFLTGDDARIATGNELDNQITGNGQANLLEGAGGNDVLDGKAGADTLVGGTGDDVYIVDNAGDVTTEVAGEGDDAVIASVSYTLGDNVETLQASGTSAMDLTGNALDNGIFGNGAANVLRGQAGNDFLQGGGGDDTYVFGRGDGRDTIDNWDFVLDTADPAAPAAVDTVRFAPGVLEGDVVALRMGDHLVLRIRGTADEIVVQGHFEPPTASGTKLYDRGIDRVVFEGGATWDRAMIQTVVDRAASNRAPVVNANLPALSTRGGVAFSYTVPAGLITDPDAGDVLVFSASLEGGAPLPDWLHFDAATRTFSGVPAASGPLALMVWATDSYGVTRGTGTTLTVGPMNNAPTIGEPLAARGTVQGNELSFVLPGNAFADTDAGETLTYRATLAGGEPLPEWIVFDPLTRRFTVNAPGLGTWSVSVIATDAGGLEAINSFDVVVRLPDTVGSGGDDILQGGGGADTLEGLAGNDQLLGAGGDDLLVGGLGDDALTGGTGNDTYAFALGDGADRITNEASLSGGTPDTAAVDVLRFETGIAVADVRPLRVGNDLVLQVGTGSDQVTIAGYWLDDGHSAAGHAVDEIRFADGTVWTVADVKALMMQGTSGNDNLVGFESADVSDGGAGNDTIYGRGGNDTLRGGAGSDKLYGEDGDDVLYGNDDTDFDELHGGAGNDQLVGGDYAYGGDGNDVITGGRSIDAGAGDDVVSGATDFVRLGRGNDLLVLDGYYYVEVADAVPLAGETKTLRFGPAVLPEEITATRDGNNLRLAIQGEYGYVELRDFFIAPPGPGGSLRVEFAAAAGVVWSYDTLFLLVNVATQGDNKLDGTAGNDVIDALGGHDEVHGRGGDDTLYGGAGDDKLYGDEGNDTLYAGPGSVWGYDALYGGAGDDLLVDGTVMEGGTGVDTYKVFASNRSSVTITGGADGGDTILVAAGVGPGDIIVRRDRGTSDFLLTHRVTGQVVRLTGFVTASNVASPYAQLRFEGDPGTVWTYEDLRRLSTTGDARSETFWGMTDRGNNMSGAGGDDNLYGGEQADVIDGGSGRDYMEGRGGADTYLFGRDSGRDRIVDATGTGNVLQLGAGIVPADVQLVRTGQTGWGHMSTDDSLLVLIPATGATLLIDEFFKAGGTSSFSGIRFADGTTVWNLAEITTRAGTSVSGTQNAMTGTTGNDIHVVDNAGDTISEMSFGGHDVVRSMVSYTLPTEVEEIELVGPAALDATGNSGDNILRGNAGANTLKGGGGTDTYYGGAGDDLYVHSALRYNYAYGLFNPVTPLIHENAGEGYDTISTDAWALTMSENVERLVVSQLMDIWSYSYYPGDSHQYTYVGNGLDNVIDIGAADFGGFSLTSVRIDGGAGADVMIGSRQRIDTYVVDNVGDVIVESVLGGGQVEASISYTLDDYLVNLSLTGSDAIDGTGNQYANYMRGDLNTASNRLAGLGGNDTYRVDAGDVVVEAENGGIDKVIVAAVSPGFTGPLRLSDWANIEELELATNLGNMDIEGSARADKLYGSRGNNVIRGFEGDDWIASFNNSGISPSEYQWSYTRDVLDGGDGNDNITSLGGTDVVLGGNGNDTINLWSVILAEVDAGAGDDTLSTNLLTQGFRWKFGDGTGADTLDVDRTRTQEQWNADRRSFASLDLAAGTDASRLRLARSGNNLVVQLAGSTDGVTILDFFDATTGEAIASVDTIRLPDGTTLTRAALLAGLGQADLQAASADDDLLVASPGGSSLDGGEGNDHVAGQHGDDQLAGGAGNDSLYGASGADVLEGGAGDDYLVGGLGADTYRFGLGWGNDIVDEMQRDEGWLANSPSTPDDGAVDVIEFDATIAISDLHLSAVGADLVITHLVTGDVITVRNFMSPYYGEPELIRFADGTTWDRIEVERRMRSIDGTEGDDTLVATERGNDLFGYGGNDVLVGNWGDDKLYGADGTDQLDGGDGYDLLDGGTGADTMLGGYGDDIYIVDNAGDVLTEYSNQGWDAVESSVTWTLGSHFENLTLTGTANINGTGNSLSNYLSGNDGNNVLNGGFSADEMYGGLGDDTYVVDNVGDIVWEEEGQGTDLVQSSVDWTLGDHFENLTLTGSGSRRGTGNALDNVLTGNSGANVLTGGAGNDTYVVGSGDSAVELTGEGIDTVRSSVTWTLGVELENLVLTGSSSIGGTGNALDNQITGNGAANTLNGGDGNDVLDGGAGADTLVGGTGNDTYYVDHASDVTTESASAGTDTVIASVNWTLATNVENLVLAGTGNISGTGNTGNNQITGNAGANAINGGTGADTMTGGAGNDTYTVDNAGDAVVELAGEGTDTVNSSITHTLAANVENLVLTGTTAINGTGNAGDNVLTGNSAANTLTGGAGNDTYVVGTGDTVVESANAGTDTVQSSITYTLGNNVENLVLTGTSAINGTGNALDNVLTGNSAANTLTGGAGNDTYVIGTGDTVVENANAGTDTVQSSITYTLGTNLENLVLLGSTAINGTGNASANLMTGNSGANTLTGAAGNDTLDGREGADTLNGGTGNDSYRLGRGWGADVIQDDDTTAGNLDRALFESGIATDQLWFARSGDHLAVTIIGTGDRFTVNNWYLGTRYRVEEFRTSDGRTLLESNVQNLVNAMAAFAPPAAGETTLPASYQAALQPVIAANWQ